MSRMHLNSSRGHRGPIAVFLVLFLTSMFAVFRMARNPSPSGDPRATFSQLGQTYSQKGIDSFLSEKQRLHEQVRTTLQQFRNTDGVNEVAAIATYLFPELLSPENFEREAGADLWAPHEAAIEKEPGTRAARKHFEVMRANIWNYESADRRTPTISATARHVIQIYDLISRVD